MVSNKSFIFVTILSLTLFFFATSAPSEEATQFSNDEQEEDYELVSEESAESSNEGIELIEAEDQTKNIVKVIGDKTHIKDYPYTAAVIARTYHFGSAVILNKQWLLTSGWVVSYEIPSQVLVRVGSDSAIDKGQTSWASKIVLHPNYNHTWAYDLALIKLQKPIKFDKNVKPIKLAGKPPSKGSNAVVSGFGFANSTNEKEKSTHSTLVRDGWLREAKVDILPYPDCSSYYSRYPAFTNVSLCTTAKTESGPCGYDYGSPLVVDNKLVGVFSTVPTCTSANYPPIYTDVVKLKAWVESTIKKHSHPRELRDIHEDNEQEE